MLLKNPNSGKPEFGGTSILRNSFTRLFRNSFAKEMDAGVKPANDDLVAEAYSTSSTSVGAVPKAFCASAASMN